jgi:hypothetical protein
MAGNNNQAALVAAGQGQAQRQRQQPQLVVVQGGANSAQTNAVERVAKSNERKARAAERESGQLAEAGHLLMMVGETMTANALSSFAHGALGEKIAPMGFDLRGVLGPLMMIYGAYDVAHGGEIGGHAIAVGSGVLQSLVASGARGAGERWVNAPPSLPAAAPAGQGLLAPPEVAEGPFPGAGRGQQRAVFLTPDDAPPRHQRVFLTPEDDEEEDEEEQDERGHHGHRGRPPRGRGGQETRGRGPQGRGGRDGRRESPNRFRDARPR